MKLTLKIQNKLFKRGASANKHQEKEDNIIKEQQPSETASLE